MGEIDHYDEFRSSKCQYNPSKRKFTKINKFSRKVTDVPFFYNKTKAIIKWRLINWIALWKCNLISIYFLKLVLSHFISCYFQTHLVSFYPVTLRNVKFKVIVDISLFTHLFTSTIPIKTILIPFLTIIVQTHGFKAFFGINYSINRKILENKTLYQPKWWLHFCS